MADAAVIEAPSNPRATKLLARFSILVVAWNILVVVWGALVRATGSGAGCGNHWPLCNGQVIPVSPGIHTIIEFTHRMMTGGSAILMLALVLLTLGILPKPHPARKAVGFATLLLFFEAILGALLVKLGYVTGNRSTGRVIMLSIHFANTLLLLGSLTLTAWLLNGRRVARIRRGLWLTIAATMATGISGSLAALGDTLFPATSLRAAFLQDTSSASPMLLRLRGIHPLSVALATIGLLWAARLARHRSALARRLSTITLAILAIQIIVGIADILWLAPWPLQLIHLFAADLYWVALLCLVFELSHPRITSSTTFAPQHPLAYTEKDRIVGG